MGISRVNDADTLCDGALTVRECGPPRRFLNVHPNWKQSFSMSLKLLIRSLFCEKKHKGIDIVCQDNMGFFMLLLTYLFMI